MILGSLKKLINQRMS